MKLPESLYEKFGVEFQMGQIIFCEFEPGNECYFILEGKVRIVKNVHHAQKTMDIIGEGSFFGEMAILEAAPRSASAIAIQKTRALKFTSNNFDALMNSQPQLAYSLLLIFASRIYDAKRRLQILLLKDPQIKVSDVFLMLSEKDPHYGKVSEMIFPISVDDVASWCSLPVGDVQRIINLLVKRGKVELHADRIIVHNINDFSRSVAAHRRSVSKS